MVKAYKIPTMVQCRSEEPFKPAVRLQYVPKRGLIAVIDCPHCGRGYYLNNKGTWMADRPLVILSMEG